ncbi:hypothetical protein LTR10_017327 [Elasticomyces elasticus]|uniref:PWI domain-containing protein n=1 Tax=Exophiala sideris TaxID=1016849 RepID=A0ABR0J8V3_9EURO|nr:hypothetical protein LTR10_017327 [Elasticomyces elasticus]KAK5027916.1 hypothetical protein LTS07_006792 [Exophiala sideris]KAK5037494.1 hypothetical protein LTR13_004651 [Exophiala sideris]KAK5059155.1 hypothetical protein LTR69_006444 [Exophiala sideris]KAK5182989.1 hypothetical protein LTR44_004699 [Eurotiomycetes sp. CCFEE 6388]
MYNPYQAPGHYGAPGDYGAMPGAPPGLAPPPGMVAPGMGAPPGMQQQEAHQPGRPGAFPPNFQPPPNMPNINFSAPVIRLGTSGPPKPDGMGGRDERDRGGRRAGVGSGMGSDFRGGERERITQVQPQTKEEIIKTIFVGGITEGAGGDEGIERILRAAGNLRRWIRATDADEKPCKFGFAEYEDPESLSTAIEVLRDVEVPVKRQTSGEAKADEESTVEMSRLIIVADDNSHSYLEQWEESIGGRNADQVQMQLDHARSALEAVLKDLTNPSVPTQKDELSNIDREGDVSMTDGANGTNGDVVTIAINVDDELSDIPAEMRETVAKEIAAFRDRSNRRDLERLRREEEVEQQERNRMMNGERSNRLASPPPSAPSGPAGANGIPMGPRGAPAGPKGFGSQIPKDYQKGVTFVNGTLVSGASAFEDEDTDASDEELERRRKANKDSDLEKYYLDQERRWINREKSRTAAVDREKGRDTDEATRINEEKEAMAKRLREWNDDTEASRKTEEYYADRSIWTRNRQGFRQREIADDDADRAAEQRERARENRQRERAGAMADDFLSRQEEEMTRREPEEEERERQQAPREPARFKLSLGAAAQKAADKSASQATKRTVAEVEGLLEDEEEESASGARRTLIPIQYDASTTSTMTDEERAQAAKQLAADIPNDKDGLWNWDVKWEFVDEGVIEERLKPFVEKKIVEYLGVQEQMLVDYVVNALQSRGKPQDLVGELEGALDEEAEALVRKLWRMLIFFSESEKRGLAA